MRFRFWLLAYFVLPLFLLFVNSLIVVIVDKFEINFSSSERGGSSLDFQKG